MLHFDHFDGLIPIPNLLLSDAFIRARNAPIHFWPGLWPGTRLGSLLRSPMPLVGGDTPYRSPRRLQCLKQCPKFLSA